MSKSMYTDKFLDSYRDQAITMLSATVGRELTSEELDKLNDTMDNTFEERTGELINTYQPEKNRPMKISNLIGWWLDKTPPVISGSGAMFISEENGGSNVTGSFVDMLLKSRKAVKNQMFAEPDKNKKAMLDMKQKVFKVLTNAYYGALGQKTFIFHDRNSAAGVTGSGVSIITMLIQVFEQFMGDNWKFECWGDIFEFIELSNKKMENDQFDICDIEGVEKDDIIELVSSRLIGKLPTNLLKNKEEFDEFVQSTDNSHSDNIRRLLNKLYGLSVDQLTRLYYRNNLYEFLEESYVMEEILPELLKFSIPSGNRSDIEEGDLSLTLDLFSDLILEYVSLPVQYEEKMNFCNTRVRESVLLTDTDSVFLLIDKFILWVGEQFPDYEITSFENRVTVCNMLIYVVGDISQIVLDDWSMRHFVDKAKYPLLNLKNEFLYSRIMITHNKKSYAG